MNDAARISSRMRDLLQHLKVSAERLGWQVSLLSGLRTCAEQKKVNPTLPCSYHLSGDAIDVQLIYSPHSIITTGPLPGPVIFQPLEKSAMLQVLGSVAKQRGFRWGADFKQPDPNHFDDGVRKRSPDCCDGRSGRTRNAPVSAGKRLTAAQNVHERINAVSSALVALRKEHLALDELVSQWMARSATRAKRERKKEREAEEEDLEPVQETG